MASGLAKRRGGLPSPEDTNRVCPSDWRAGLAIWQTAPHDWRAGLALARSFPRECARGKVLGGQSQDLVAYGLERREYFANLIANLAIWQSARSWRKPPVIASLHLVACNAVQRGAMQCRGVRAMCATCNDRLANWRAGLALARWVHVPWSPSFERLSV